MCLRCKEFCDNEGERSRNGSTGVGIYLYFKIPLDVAEDYRLSLTVEPCVVGESSMDMGESRLQVLRDRAEPHKAGSHQENPGYSSKNTECPFCWKLLSLTRQKP